MKRHYAISYVCNHHQHESLKASVNAKFGTWWCQHGFFVVFTDMNPTQITDWVKKVAPQQDPTFIVLCLDIDVGYNGYLSEKRWEWWNGAKERETETILEPPED